MAVIRIFRKPAERARGELSGATFVAEEIIFMP
jgi:hypothetical protein